MEPTHAGDSGPYVATPSYPSGDAVPSSEVARGGQGSGTASLVLGIVAIVGHYALIFPFGIVVGSLIDGGIGVVALVLGLKSRADSGGGASSTGIVLGAVACMFSAIWLFDLFVASVRTRF